MTAVTASISPNTANDNLFGICAAVGEDLGFNPLYLRLAFATALLINLEAVLLTYVGLGVIVMASRLLFPNRKHVDPPKAEALTSAAVAEPVEEYRKAA